MYGPSQCWSDRFRACQKDLFGAEKNSEINEGILQSQ